MRPVSAGWESTIRGSHDAVFRATVCDTFQTGTTPTGTRIGIIGGAVRVDGFADIRSTLDLTTPGVDELGDNMWPKFVDDPLAPYGNEIYVERGVKYSDFEVEYVGLGYFRIQAPDQADAPAGPIRLTAEDRMAAIIEARLLAPVQFNPPTSLGTIVDQLITDVYPDAAIEWDDDTDLSTLTRQVIVEEDRYGFLDDIVKSRAKIWYWDHRGVLTIRSLPDSTDIVYEVNSGRDGVLVDAARHITRERVFNAWVVTGEGGDTEDPARGVAVDNDPNSPTFFYGRFGQVPAFYSSPLVSDDSQAAAAARALLLRQLGLPYVVNFGAVPNPALEPFDPVGVRYSNVDGLERHVLATLNIPLEEGSKMTATTREQTVVLVGSA